MTLTVHPGLARRHRLALLAQAAELARLVPMDPPAAGGVKEATTSALDVVTERTVRVVNGLADLATALEVWEQRTRATDAGAAHALDAQRVRVRAR